MTSSGLSSVECHQYTQRNTAFIEALTEVEMEAMMLLSPACRMANASALSETRFWLSSSREPKTVQNGAVAKRPAPQMDHPFSLLEEATVDICLKFVIGLRVKAGNVLLATGLDGP